MPWLSRFVVVKVVGELLFLYGFLAWVYGVLVQLFHLYWVAFGLSHLTTWIRVDTFTIIFFVISAAGFLLWRLAKELVDSTLRQATR